ncbi:lytic transglycosylase domain-containing protein [Asaia bogorensis]|uniref:Transglycosylase SLT domain-containing protein n=1 Tax=Asaia bogorensis NBRC 16594 TaxID=1231624 RepID=A0AAN4R5N1_9PROT|nr:lytic transglycosylase domain-containing protein [Asaia bogorensis]GBQ81398.1 hypothetical protein AA0311_2612 [Asaia bogorensis NBRC 16594]GEL54875.1 hypothetical protein ABO01nite_28820 [Asaia bogorensis NBRC 16594]
MSISRRIGLTLAILCCPQAEAAPEVIPTIPELGGPHITATGGTTGDVEEGSDTQGSAGTATTSSPWTGSITNSDAMSALQAQSYGSSAIAAAENAGVNPATLAAFGEVESHYQNVGNATSSAQGVWQITQGTWDDTVSKYGLPYTDADRDNPTAQADVASHIIASYSATVSARTGEPATTLQAYGAYMFGPTTGASLAAEEDQSTPLNKYVSATALADNGMSGWTVGQYYSTMASRMGSGSSSLVTSG